MLAKRYGKFATLLFLLGLCRVATAHPMGNFSVNHYSKISLQGDRIIVGYFIDLAEIPTYQELQQGNIAATPMDPNSATVVRYVAARGAELGHALSLDVDGKEIPLRLVSSGVIFPPGAGGLPTMKTTTIPGAPDGRRSLHWLQPALCSPALFLQRIVAAN
jgi:nickel/cobalt exporter